MSQLLADEFAGSVEETAAFASAGEYGMQIDLSAKTALVTGSTQGIGYAIARGLASAGARVGLNGRTLTRVEEAAAHLRSDLPGADVVNVLSAVRLIRLYLPGMMDRGWGRVQNIASASVPFGA